MCQREELLSPRRLRAGPLGAAAASLLATFIAVAEGQSPAPTIRAFRDQGGQVHWSPRGEDRILYASRGRDGYYDVHSAAPDGSHDICLTCNTPGLPGKHVGSPAWHPSMRWIVVVAEKPVHPGTSFDALPGFGAYSDLWCLSVAGDKAIRLTDLPADPDHGVIIPRFSPDGKQLVWSARVERPKLFDLKQHFGYWAINIADFVEGQVGPALQNLRVYEPGGRAFYETYGFSRDGRRVLFCSSMNQRSSWDQQIYTIDLGSGDVRQLTQKDYNEHAFETPDGRTIVWMSNRQSTRGGTDWWMMDANGTNQRRLTYFNEPGSRDDMGKPVWAGLGSFSPDGRRFIGDIQTNLLTQAALIKMIELPDQSPQKPRMAPRRTGVPLK
ncbi:hypothetical protein EP7_000919 [Isosphaeraceae bacterium EP7]